jgi:hypothetical protein
LPDISISSISSMLRVSLYHQFYPIHWFHPCCPLLYNSHYDTKLFFSSFIQIFGLPITIKGSYIALYPADCLKFVFTFSSVIRRVMSSFSKSFFWKEPSVPTFSLFVGVAAWKGLWSERTFAKGIWIYKTSDFGGLWSMI